MSPKGGDLVKNAADPKQVERAKRKTNDAAERVRAAYRVVLGTPEGRIALWDVLGCCAMHQSFSGAESTLLAMLAGEREAGLRILGKCVEASEDLYDLMAREHRAYLRREAAGNEASRTPSATESTNEENVDA